MVELNYYKATFRYAELLFRTSLPPTRSLARAKKLVPSFSHNDWKHAMSNIWRQDGRTMQCMFYSFIL